MKVLQMPSPALRISASEDPRDKEFSPWAIYRNHTIVLLRRFFRMSLSLGRMPSLLGGELFRAKVTAYQVKTFEDTVIFVHDMEQCLGKLDPLAKKLIARIVFEEFRHDEVAKELRITRRQVIRRMHQAVDRVTELLLEAELLEPFCAPDGLPLKKSPVSVGKVANLRAMEGDW
jgi:hypothetical protein